MEKMTYKMAITYALDNCELPNEIREKLEALRESISKKSASSSGKPSKKQVENQPLIEKAFEAVTFENQTVSDILKQVPEFAEFSNQKVSYLLNSLAKEKRIIKEVIKGKTYFHLA